MDNQEIRDMIQEKANDIPMPDSLSPEKIEKTLEESMAAGKRKANVLFYKKIAATAACLAVVCAALFGLRPLFNSMNSSNNITTPIAETPETDNDSAYNASSYKEICDSINKYNEEYMRKYKDSLDFYEGEYLYEDAAVGNADSTQKSSSYENNAEMDAAPSSSDSSDYSDTDTQVDGIMEGDIVKTDGRHIFTLAHNTGGYAVCIYRADGPSVKKLSQVSVSKADCAEMYIEGSTLIMIGNLWEEGVSDDLDTEYEYEQVPKYYEQAPHYYEQVTHITLYDISDPENPTAIRQLTQSGSYNTSRVSDGYLYAFSNYHLPSYTDFKEDEPKRFMPDVNGRTMEASEVHLPNKKGADAYMVMTSLKISDSSDFADSQAILGAFDTYYMNHNHIYAIKQEYSSITGSIRSAIIKYAYENGKFSYQASAKVRGEINDSYYMHEYKNNFVFVYTRDSWSKSTNGLCVMDKDLNIIGELSDLGVSERIYASYFIDHMAYFVTFRNTDPVFAVDISNPKKPVLKSELKLPGFSSYLHSFGDDMLIGIGSGDSSGELDTDQVKLSLFSISEDYEIREIDKKFGAPDTDTYADSNHKAVFVDEKRGLIGFGIVSWIDPDDSAYVIYHYDKGRLKKVLSVPVSDRSIDNIRGLRIGEYFYIVDTEGGIKVYDINTWETAK